MSMPKWASAMTLGTTIMQCTGLKSSKQLMLSLYMFHININYRSYMKYKCAQLNIEKWQYHRRKVSSKLYKYFINLSNHNNLYKGYSQTKEWS